MEEEIINSKKPDNYVENAGLLPYGSNIGAPAIHIPNIESWKQPRVIHVNQQFQDKVEELKNEYQMKQKLSKEEWEEEMLENNSYYDIDMVELI